MDLARLDGEAAVIVELAAARRVLLRFRARRTALLGSSVGVLRTP